VDGNRTFLRTGFQAHDIGEISGSDFSASILVMHITDANDTTIMIADLEDSIALPISEEELTVNTLNLSSAGGNLQANGSGTYDAGIAGNIAVNYTYDFSLDPVTSALSSRVVDVETVSTSVTGAQGGLLGWLINGIVNLITLLFKGTIAARIEDSVQAQVDAAVAAAFAAAGAPDEAMATVRSVTINTDSVVIDPWVSIPLAAIDCGALLSSGSIKIRDRKQLRKMRRMRDRVLRYTPQGHVYIKLLKRHSPELVRILARRPRLLKQVDRLVKQGLAEFSEERPEDGVLTAETAKMGKELMQQLAKEASPNLRRTIEMTLPDVDQFVNTPVRKVLDRNTEALRKLGD
jgi:hypothetical protein